jgi:hypothetical protein
MYLFSISARVVQGLSWPDRDLLLSGKGTGTWKFKSTPIWPLPELFLLLLLFLFSFTAAPSLHCSSVLPPFCGTPSFLGDELLTRNEKESSRSDSDSDSGKLLNRMSTSSWLLMTADLFVAGAAVAASFLSLEDFRLLARCVKRGRSFDFAMSFARIES